MQTRILKGDELSLAVESLRGGEPVVFPTETVYGLGAPVFQEEAIRRVFAIKGRPLDNPLIAHIAYLEQVPILAEGCEASFYALAEAFWPGPLTIVVKRRLEVPALVSAGGPTIAIRMPAHRLARQLIELCEEPLVAPSANLSGKPSPTCPRDVLEDLEGRVQYILDGGDCEVGIESTVISLYHSVPTLLRPGKISREEIAEVLGRPVVLPPSTEEAVYSPGMKYRHYAPKAAVKLIFQKEELTGHYIIPTPKTLYAQLREADRAGATELEIYCDSLVQADEALMNRLLRASGRIE